MTTMFKDLCSVHELSKPLQHSSEDAVVENINADNQSRNYGSYP